MTESSYDCSQLRVALATLIVGLTASSAAYAGTPLVLRLARAHHAGSVAISARTAHLRSQMWITRGRGVGVARGSARVSCQQSSSLGRGGDIEIFSFKLAPGSRQELWRFGGTDVCVVDISLRGTGQLAVALRGY